MAYNTYFGSKPVSDWVANGPAESGHNFIDRINEQKTAIGDQQNKYNAQYNKVGQAQNAYDQAYGGQQSYGDLYRQAKGEEGVDNAKSQYEKSLNSVNATISTMNTLPSSVNANSNVVLNSNQRNAALGNQMARYQNTLDYQTRQNAGDLSRYQNALGAAQNLAKTNMGQEQAKVAQSMTNLQTQMDMANKRYSQVANEKNLMHQIYGQMYDDEYHHMQNEIQAWAKNLDAETARYAQDQETARNNARLAADKAKADISKYLGSGYKWDGNAWVRGNNNKDIARANDLSNIQKVYAAYQAKLGDLDQKTGNIGTYFDPFGANGIIGSGLGFNSTRNQANNLRKKGFEDFLYNYNSDGLNGKYLQKLLREDYGDMLSAYGLQ